MDSGSGTEPPAGSGTAPRRLHPSTLLFSTLEIGRGFLLPAIVGGASAGGDDIGHAVAWALAILAVPALLLAVGKYVSYRYWIAGDELIIASGVLSRRRRTIPLARVQNIDVRQSALERLFGVVELRVETAGGNRSEAVLSVLDRAPARELEARLVAGRAAAAGAGRGSVSEDSDAARTTVLAHLSPRELALAGATANEAGIIAAGLAGALQLTNDLPIGLPGLNLDFPALVPAAPVLATALVGLSAIVSVLLLGWAVSIAGAIVGYHGFRLERTGAELRKRYGLIARREAFVPLERVQAIRVEESLLRRPLGLAALKIETAGAAPGERGRGGSEAFVPLARVTDIPRFAAAVFGDFDYAAVRFEPVHPRARRRAFMRYALPPAAVVAGLAIVVDAVWLLLLFGALPAAAVAARWHYRGLGYALMPGHFLARAGFLNRVTWIVPDGKVQTLHLVETPLQRRHGLATVVADTAAGSGGEPRVSDLGAGDAVALLETLSRRAAPSRTT